MPTIRFITVFLLIAPKVLASSVDAFYMDPFDIAAGGTSLTHATQEGILANNPAQLPYGSKNLRWIGNKTTLSIGQDTLGIATSLRKMNPSSLENTVLKHPVHFGVSESLAFLTRYAGIAAIASTAPDMRFWQYGDPTTGAGTPDIVLQNQSYGGLYGSLASKTLWKVLSVGATAKYFLIDQKRVAVDLTDQKALTHKIKEFTAISPKKINRGFGIDLSSLFFLQGAHVDWRLGLSVQNLGGMKTTGEKVLKLPETFNAGTALTFHTQSSALHFLADFRDLTNAMHEENYSRIYLGAKLLLFTYVGVAAGIYEGRPTYGAEVDLLIFRLALSSFTHEYGDRPGVDSRPIYMLSLSTGVSI